MIPVATDNPREALRAWRESIPYCYREVAEVFGVSKGAVGMWETGRCRVPVRVQQRLVAEGWLRPQPRRQPRPPAQDHQPRCEPGTGCRSCAMRRHNATWTRRLLWNRWLPKHEAALSQLAGTMPLPDLAAVLSAQFGIPRTAEAIHVRAGKLHLSLQHALLGTSQVAYYCARPTVTVEHWAERGDLVGRQTNGPQSPWVFTASNLEAFIRSRYPWLDWRTMPPSRWRNLAEVLWRRDPVYPVAVAARLLGVSPTTLRTYCAAGTIPAERIQGGSRAGRWWAVRRSAMAQFQLRRPASLGNRNGQRRSA